MGNKWNYHGDMDADAAESAEDTGIVLGWLQSMDVAGDERLLKVGCERCGLAAQAKTPKLLDDRARAFEDRWWARLRADLVERGCYHIYAFERSPHAPLFVRAHAQHLRQSELDNAFREGSRVTRWSGLVERAAAND